MGGVNTVLRQFLPRRLDGERAADGLGPLLGVLELLDLGELEAGGLVVGVVPRGDCAVAFDGGVGRHHLPLVHPIGVGDVGVVTLGIEAPAVERAHDLAVLHDATVPEVRAQVGAEGVVDVGFAVVVAPQHQVAVEVLQRDDVADLQLLGVRHGEPAVGHRER